MKYQGSKARIGRSIAKVIDTFKPKYIYEPFCGGLNLTQYLSGIKYCSDNNPYLIAMWEAVLYNNWQGVSKWDEDQYYDIRINKEDYEPEVVGWVGFCTFGGGFFNGFPRMESRRNFFEEYKKNILKQKESLTNVILSCQEYKTINPKEGSLIYCDPPYASTKEYYIGFNHQSFYQWVREMNEKYPVLISEYSAPKDFRCLWATTRTSTMKNSKTEHQEKLYIHESRYKGYIKV